MGYFEGLTGASFKKTEDEKTVFFPHGKFGAGYILTEEEEYKIKRFIKTYYMISFPIIIIAVTIFKVYALFLLVIEIPFYLIIIKKMLKSSEKSKEKLTIKDTTNNMGKSMGLAVSILLLIASLLMTTMGVLCLTIPKGRIIGVIATAFFGIGVVQSVFLIRASIKNKKK